MVCLLTLSKYFSVIIFFLDSFKDFFNLNKSRIYNIEFRKKPAELVRKDLISAMKYPDHEVVKNDEYLLILDHWREDWEKGVQIPVNPESLPTSRVTLNEVDITSESCENNFSKLKMVGYFVLSIDFDQDLTKLFS